MKNLYILGLLALAACTSGKDTGETGGDTDTDTDTNPTEFAFVTDGAGKVIPTGAGMACDDGAGTCTFTFTVTSTPSLLEVDMTETADSYLWTEYHDGFALASTNADGSETWTLTVDQVDSADDQVQNESTLFGKESVQAGTTWYFGAVSEDGATTDCVVTGDNPSYYSEWCTYVE